VNNRYKVGRFLDKNMLIKVASNKYKIYAQTKGSHKRIWGKMVE
jgi:hypothetical protein